METFWERNIDSGGLLGCGVIIAAGLLIWAAVLAVRNLKRAKSRLDEKIRTKREKRAVDQMSNPELIETAVHGERGMAYLALERLEDAASLLEIAQCADKNSSRRAAIKYCALYGHDWEGCKCRVCGKFRDEEHDWVGCKCRICGKERDEEHDWEGCKCRICGKERDEEHDWEGCKCRICGKERDADHDWDGCKCKRCGKTRDVEHDWNGVVCRRCGAVMPHEHVWKYAYTEIDESCSCGSCNKPKAGGVEDWCGDFCFGPSACAIVTQREMERCELCGELREKK